MRFLSKPVLALPVLLAAYATMAQEMPPAFPTRDVSVTYKATNGPEMQMSWLVAEQRIRVDVSGGAGAVVMDMRDKKGFMIMDEQRMAMELPKEGMPAQPGQLPPGAKVTKEGPDTVAGIACTIWLTEYQGVRSRSCITGEGVLLRVRVDGSQDGMEATKVTFAAQNPARFRVPEGFQVMQMPGGGQGAPAAR